MSTFSEKDLLGPRESFEECPLQDRTNMFVKKLRVCQVLYDFTSDANEDSHEIVQNKKDELVMIMDYIGTTKGIFTATALTELMSMISINIFRPLPADIDSFMTPDLEEEEPFMDPSWFHLHIVYEIFLRFVISGDVPLTSLPKYITVPFLNRMMEVFASKDGRERDYLKLILHRTYAKCMELRTPIRALIADRLTEHLSDPVSTSYTGIAELLEVTGTIISGYTSPLKKEHVEFLHTTLIPLHKATFYQLFASPLTYCVTQMVQKDKQLAEPVIKGLIRYWPQCNSTKELSFLEEFEDIVELLPMSAHAKLVVPVARILGHAIETPHFQVSERVLYLWHNASIVALMSRHIDQALPILFPALYKHAEAHWNASINNLALSVLHIFNEIDPDLMIKVKADFDEKKKASAETKEKRQAMWAAIEAKATAA